MLAKLRYVKVSDNIVVTGFDGFLKQEELPSQYLSERPCMFLDDSEEAIVVRDVLGGDFLIEPGYIYTRTTFSELVSILRDCGQVLVAVNKILNKAKEGKEKEIEI